VVNGLLERSLHVKHIAYWRTRGQDRLNSHGMRCHVADVPGNYLGASITRESTIVRQDPPGLHGSIASRSSEEYDRCRRQEDYDGR
jgi:hypothetical protein